MVLIYYPLLGDGDIAPDQRGASGLTNAFDHEFDQISRLEPAKSMGQRGFYG